MATLKLFAPESYRTASPEVRRQVVNGCGPGGWKIDLIPDTIWGLDISDVCDIHDWQYSVGEDIEDKAAADRTMLNNGLRKIDYHTRWPLLRWLRRRRMMKYYLAVKHFGGPAFWANKNRPQDLATESEVLVASVYQREVLA